MHQAYFVYKITCSINGKSYIGISVDPQRRLRQHRNKARNGSGYALHNAMRKHGVDTFAMTVLLEVSTEEEALQMEEKLILEHNTVAPLGYNLTVGGETPKGKLLSEKMKQMWASKSPEKMAEFTEKMKSVGADISEETRQKRSAAAKKRWADPEKESKMKTALKKAGQDPERRRAISEAAKKRWADPIFRAKMQAKYATPEQREKKRKAAAARINRSCSEETKQKIRQTKQGTTLSDEHKEKIRQSMRAKATITSA